MKKTPVLLLVLALALLTGCAQKQPLESLTDVSDLSGYRIGVPLSWNSDYALTRRDDVDLLRYSSVGDLFLALKYKRIDAMALDEYFALYVCDIMPAFEIIPQPVATDQLVGFFSMEQEELRDQFDAFMAEFITTAEYADLLARARAIDGASFETIDVPLTGTGEPIRMGCEDYFPYTYLNFETGECDGIEIEIAHHFANWVGRPLEITLASIDAGLLSIIVGNLDMMLTGLSDHFRVDVELIAGLHISEPYFPIDIQLITLGDEAALGEVPENFE